MFSKTAARSKSYFLGLPAAAMAMGHSTVVQPFRRMRTKVRKTTAKFRRHTPLAPAIEDSAHNTAVLTPVLAPLSPLEIETWFRRSPSPPPPSSSASTPPLQNQSDSASASASQRQDTEDFDAGSTSQVSGNPLWAQRFLPGLRIPNGFDMNNNAGAQSLSPISPVPSPSPLYPSNMISPMSFYSQDSIPQIDHSYPSTIDTTISLTTPITDIFTNTNTNTNDSNENDEDFTPYGHEYTNSQMFGRSPPTEYVVDGQVNGNTTPYELRTNALRFSGSEAIEYTIEGPYGTRMKELPSPHIEDIEDIDPLELGPPAQAPKIIGLPAETSLNHILSGQDFTVIVNGPSRADSAFDVQAIDDIQREMVNACLPLAKIDIEVTSGCEEVPYAGEILNDLLCVLQSCSICPNEIAVRLPLMKHQDVGMGITHALLQTLKNIPSLVPWWRHGRMDIGQLTRLTLSYPLPLDDLIELVSRTPCLEELSVGCVLAPNSSFSVDFTKYTVLNKLLSLKLESMVDLEAFFELVGTPDLRQLDLKMRWGATPDTYDVCWERLERVTVSCPMGQEAEIALVERCQELISEGKMTIHH
ncbi:hypothetical protein CCMSSC00406_0007466 [Pleurotus cornucopiae]|uniref:Uncharacterized protein n=1 Tax=Pleurotus cornucopiae TaxID=5321 RepID=A0ACB7J5J4_PLECO|nr:hypothetical protein CCMSSC00406_0007466 [Pleurotus cornucopiae]